LDLKFLLRRLASIILVIWAAATLSFFAIHLLPGDPATQMLVRAGAPPQAIAQRRAQIGWDRPLTEQYARFVWSTARFDLGESWITGRRVTQMLSEAAWPTLELALGAMFVAILVGAGLGTLAATFRGTWLDGAAMIAALLGVSTPVAWSGLLALLIFSVALGWLPPLGAGDILHLILPATVLGLASAGAIARLTRAGLLDVLTEPYITVARSKGLPDRLVLARHVWPMALPPVLTVIALQFGFLLGGAAVTEAVFARQGLGRLVVEAVLSQDLPVVQGIILLSAAVYSLVNLAADALHWLLDPRVRE
jgi:ABC-type dipeptide/oligopeptide/nickel transport system permease component